MNKHQISTVRRITNNIQSSHGMPDESLSYKIRVFGSGRVMLFASNTSDLPWYANHKSACIIIGPRGGVDLSLASFDGISKHVVN